MGGVDQGWFIVMVLVFVTVLLLIWQGAATYRARVVVARDDGYRDLSARAVAAQESTQRRLDDLASQLTQVRATLESVQRTLTVVE